MNINRNILKKMDAMNPDASEVIYNALLDDLFERRSSRDPELLRYCMGAVVPEHFRYLDRVNTFSELERIALTEYHILRAMGAYMEDGKVVIPVEPAESPGDDEGDSDSTPRPL